MRLSQLIGYGIARLCLGRFGKCRHPRRFSTRYSQGTDSRGFRIHTLGGTLTGTRRAPLLFGLHRCGLSHRLQSQILGHYEAERQDRAGVTEARFSKEGVFYLAPGLT